MAYCDGGDMYTKIKSQNKKAFDEETIWQWLVQMALAIFYLHEQKILHRDMKTQNLFLKDDGI
jgi:non-specific serine/threonine protein kinase/NIMA (never in mitosis gene a)-related kinase